MRRCVRRHASSGPQPHAKPLEGADPSEMLRYAPRPGVKHITNNHRRLPQLTEWTLRMRAIQNRFDNAQLDV
eukprot:5228080-Amphidinium_carterae.1